eukprot:EG_transcript_16235
MADKELIGKGTLGFVYKVTEGGETYAIREIRIPKKEKDVIDHPGVKEFIEHVEVLMKLEHKALVKYLGVTTGDILALKQQYMGACQPLNACIAANGGRLAEPRIKRVGLQLLSGLDYLHTEGVCHRFLKSPSVFVSPDFTAYLADFDISKDIMGMTSPTGPGFFTMAGVVYHVAPEAVSDNAEYNPKADIWSFGCLLMEMVTGKAPFSDEPNVMKAMRKIVAGEVPPPPKDTPPALADLLAKCFTLDVAARPSAKPLLLHPFWH